MPHDATPSLNALQACTTAVLRSLPMLAHICVASLFLMWLFSIVGIQFYQGAPLSACVLACWHPCRDGRMVWRHGLG